MFAFVTDGTIQAVVGRPPEIVHHASDEYPQGRAWDLRPMTDEEAEPHLTAAGWYEIISTPRPADTDTHTSEVAYQFDGTVVVQGWVQREWTAEELAARQAAANEAALRADPQTHIDILLASQAAIQADVLGLTNAQINQNPAAVLKTLAREVLTVNRRTVRLARLTLGVTDSTNTGD